jgi:protein O-GlcNAc transferase
MFKIKQKKNRRALIQAEQALNTGASLQREGKLDEAILWYQKAIKLNPNVDVPYNNLGNIFQDKGQLDEAIACYQNALDLNPNFTGAYYNLGDALQDKGQLDEAIALYQRAIALDPKFASAYNNLAIVLRNKGQIEEAIICCKKAIEIDPTLLNAMYNLGNALQENGQFDEAIACFHKVLRHDPDHIGAYTNLGHVFLSLGQLDQAEMYFRHALKIKPNEVIPYQALLMALHYSTRYTAQMIFSEHVRFGKQCTDPLSPAQLTYSNDRVSTRRLRIGYISPDFRRHSVAYFIEPVLSVHDKERFEICCYSDVKITDGVTKRIQGHADQWRTIVGMSDNTVAEMIHEDAIDILVDLAGHTESNRMLLFARKPSPVQVTWIGYPGTTGLATIDYKIVDNYTDPPGMTEQFYTERLIRPTESFLCFLPDTDSPETGNLPSLTTGHISFGSFNNFSKMSPEVIETWLTILEIVPESRLLLKTKSLANVMARDYVLNAFTKAGIGRDRIALYSRVPSAKEHLKLYNDIDIALDTFPYNGTTTTCEAMWMGVPVITLAGNTHASRVGVSLLSNVGLKEFIAQTSEEYINIAVNLARDIQRLQFLREHLRNMMTKSPLCDSKRFTANLETCYRRMWETWCRKGIRTPE